ncbi:MAG: esterase family protein, partial [Sodaliphilus sp.]|nr:esterase family protein [Sodaliphilus sp.]
FYEVNCNLHKALLDAKIPHDFTIRPGAHTWEYWTNAIDYQMLFFAKAFAK